MTTVETLVTPPDLGCESASIAPDEEGKSKGETPTIIRVPLDTLKPNPINLEIFWESLKPKALEDMVRNIAEHGQREAIIINPENTILEGHRRWRALQLGCATHAYVVIDRTRRSAEEEQDYILDSYTHKRRASLAERVEIFERLVDSYSRRFGRPRGRPKKVDQDRSNYWDANRVRDQAAKVAGFTSRETARQAVAVFRSKRDDLKKGLEKAELSIDAAYQLLQPSPAPSADNTNEESDASGPASTGPQLPDGVPGRATKTGAGRVSKPRRRHADALPGERSSRRRPEAPVVSNAVETAGDVAPEGTSATEGGATARPSSDAPPGGPAPAGEINIETALEQADMDELTQALCSRIRATADNEGSDFDACVERVLNEICRAAGKSCELKPLAKTSRRPRKVA